MSASDAVGGAREPVALRARLLLAWAAACLLAGVLHALLDVLRWANVSDATGALATLASDMQQGRFYRPLLAGDALGGSRYMPLFPWLASVLAPGPEHVVDAGVWLGFAAALGALVATFALVRQATGSRVAAVAAAAVLAGSGTWQLNASTGRADAMAMLLQLAGLLAVARATPRAVLAGVLFGLAFVTKFTGVWGPAAAGLLLLSQRRLPAVARLCAAWAVTVAATALLLDVALGGHFVHNLANCATSGASPLAGQLAAPFRALTRLLDTDPILFVVPALVLVSLRWLVATSRPGALAWATSLAVTLVVFANGSSEAHHLLDFVATSCTGLGIVLAATAAEPLAQHAHVLCRRLTIVVLAVASCMTLLAWVDDAPYTPGVLKGLQQPDERAQWLADARWLPTVGVASTTHVLADNNVPLLLRGMRPFVGDAWMVGSAGGGYADRMQALVQQHVREGRFDAILLVNDPTTPAGRYALDVVRFGAGFSDLLLQHYVPAARGQRVVVWTRR